MVINLLKNWIASSHSTLPNWRFWMFLFVPSWTVDVERHARDFMEAAKKLQSYFISLQREDQPTAEDMLRKVHSLHPHLTESGVKMCTSYGLLEREWGLGMVIGELEADWKLSLEVGIAILKITYFYLLQAVCDTQRDCVSLISYKTLWSYSGVISFFFVRYVCNPGKSETELYDAIILLYSDITYVLNRISIDSKLNNIFEGT